MLGRLGHIGMPAGLGVRLDPDLTWHAPSLRLLFDVERPRIRSIPQ
jgi:hypothetical protein